MAYYVEAFAEAFVEALRTVAFAAEAYAVEAYAVEGSAVEGSETVAAWNRRLS